jgi:hypothetical protein
VTRWAVEPLDLLRELRKLRPTVVQFSGHGGRGLGAPGPRRADAPRRDVGGGTGSGGGTGAGGGTDDAQDGLYFQGPDGRPQLVSTAALEATFGAAGSSVKLIVLSACYSDVQAEALLAHVHCVVGMRGSISDDAARIFAIGFYGGLGEGESVAAAYRQGRAAISLESLRDSDLPQLQVLDGVDAERLVLASDTFASATPANAAAAGSTNATAVSRAAAGPARTPAASGAAPGPVNPAAGPAAPHAKAPGPPDVDIGILTIAETRMTRDQLLNRLRGLLPSQFDEVLFRARIPLEYLSGNNAAQATRAVDAIRYLEQQNRLDHLAQAIEDVAPTARPKSGRTGASDPR